MFTNPLNRTTTLAATGLLLGLTPAVPAVSPSFSELVPERTILIAGADSAEAALGRIRGTRLWDMWESEEMKDPRTEMLTRMMDELGLDEDTLQPPTGQVGLAIFTVVEEEFAPPTPGYFFLADYGPNADRASTLIDTALERGEGEEELTFEEVEIAGRTARHIEFNGPPDELDELGNVQGLLPPEFGEMMGLDPGMFGEMSSVYVVREIDTFLVSSTKEVLEHALQVWDGDENGSFGKREDYMAVREQLGRQDVYAVLLTRDLGPLISSVDPTGMAMMFGPMITQVIGDIDGLASGARFGGPTAMVEQTSTVYMPNGKMGLSSLLHDDAVGKMPSFVSQNAISYSEVNFRFQGMPAALQQLLQMMQMMMPPEQDGPSMPQIFSQACSLLGDRMHLLQTLDRPIQRGSLRQLVAIECEKPEEFDQLLAQIAPMTGMEPRDFLGHRVYTMDPAILAGMAPMPMDMPAEPPAVGLGGGYLLYGPSGAVEQALRTAGHDDNALLEDEEAFLKAVGTLRDGPVIGWGFTNLVDSYEAAMETAQLEMEEFMKMLEEEDPELVAELRAEGELEDLDQTGIDPDFMRRYLGPYAWKMVGVEDGFRMTSYLHGAGGE